MSLPQVVGLGIGFRQRARRATDEICLIVMVNRKLPLSDLAAEDIVPRALEGAPVDVIETGPIRA